MGSRIRTGQGRVEFLTYHQEIYKLLEQGYTIISVYEQLKNEGKLSLSYPSFTALLRYDRISCDGSITNYVRLHTKVTANKTATIHSNNKKLSNQKNSLPYTEDDKSFIHVDDNYQKF